MMRFAFGLLLIIIPRIVAQEQFTFSGRHLRVTAKYEGSFLNFGEKKSGDVTGHAEGYLAEMIEEISVRANFTYELWSPSGRGSHCEPRLDGIEGTYAERYTTQFDCGADDVNEMQGTPFGTDIYLASGLYYISPPRQELNYFTVPFSPPFKGTPAMYGTATGIRNIEELVELQQEGKYSRACVLGSSAVPAFLRDSFRDPDIQIQEFFGNDDATYDALGNGTCDLMIFDAPIAAQFVLKMSQTGRCQASNNMPIGIIGDPMEFGLSHYSVGVGKHLRQDAADNLSYWINEIMVDGFLAEKYEGRGGTGQECGYVLFPPVAPDRLLSDGEIFVTVIVPVVAIALTLYCWHYLSLKRQEKRYKMRFVQQIARNIEIGPSPGYIKPEKLSEEILHIGNGKNTISKEDLRQWLQDVKMDFLSEEDFEALWDAMDVDETGEVDAVEFVVFLSACGPEFNQVYEHQQTLTKKERLKLAARRLTNLALMGETGVRRMQNKLDRSSGGFIPTSSLSAGSLSSRALQDNLRSDIRNELKESESIGLSG